MFLQQLIKLNEMPDFIPKEVKLPPMQISYSNNTMKTDFDMVGSFDDNDTTYFVAMRKDGSEAVLGKAGIRDEATQEVGFIILGSIDFKDLVEFSYFKDLSVPRNVVIQVDGVGMRRDKKTGSGNRFYFTLAKTGYVIISDNTQYIGGKQLWLKIARDANKHNCEVYVVEDGSVILDDSGKPLVYNGENLPEERLWGSVDLPPNERKKFTLFILLNK